MKTRIIIIILSLMVFSACEKREDKLINYVATDATSEFTIQYRDASGILMDETVQAESALDMWNHAFIAPQGGIVYLSGKYTDINSSLKLIIYVDGKIYKQGSSIGDTLKYITVSGVIPY